MRELSVKVQNDYLERMVAVKNPVFAIAELIWNSLDAEATKVEVFFRLNDLDAVETIFIQDNGHGMDYEEITVAFENLGGSWKKHSTHTKRNLRRLHGKRGQGRFQAFAVGQKVSWKTCYMLHRHPLEYTISGLRTRLGTFTIADDPKEVKNHPTGTLVTIEGVDNGIHSLVSSKSVQTITESFALYLLQYPNVEIIYDGNKINPADAQEHVDEIILEDISTNDGDVIHSRMTIIEWKNATERILYLCDTEGFALSETKPKIQAPGFDFTAYLKSNYFKQLDEKNLLGLEELNPNVKKITDVAKKELRDYFRKKAAESASKLVQEWKEEEIYPYKGEPKSILEETERQVFDVVALSIHDYLPDFENIDNKNKKFTFSLLKQAIEESPKAVQLILEEVLELPKEKQEEFAELLKKTSLTAIINASKLVTNRLDFLKGLEILVFDPQSKKLLLERKQLHKIIAEETWLFGEEFNLTVNDESLTAVLNKHIHLLGRTLEDDSPVLREDGSRGIVDLMLSRSVPQTRPEEKEHLIIELKRPKVSINYEAADQLESYAYAVASDERFRDTTTKWIFWAVSNEIDDSIRRRANQRNRAPGLLFEAEEQRITIWVKTWGQLLENCRARLNFFQRELSYSAEKNDALAYLREVHEKYLPTCLSEDEEVRESIENPV
jgi:hypothetical protein